MIDLKLLEKKPENGPSYLDEYKQCLVNRGAEASILDQVIELNKKRKELITQSETAKSQQNKVSGEIAIMKRNGQDASQLIKEMGEISTSVKEMEVRASEAEAKVLDLLMTLPNKTHASVPVGKSGDDNIQVKMVGEPTQFKFKAKEHWELGEKLGLIDFERAGKVTGTRFAFLTG
ncbi:MAG: serine--tRNA ligase, partial [Pseudobdellovibrionaceae bacterium]